jgi:hypothetical protein
MSDQDNKNENEVEKVEDTQVEVEDTKKDDDEYEIAADAFDEWMDTQEFEESGDDE